MRKLRGVTREMALAKLPVYRLHQLIGEVGERINLAASLAGPNSLPKGHYLRNHLRCRGFNRLFMVVETNNGYVLQRKLEHLEDLPPQVTKQDLISIAHWLLGEVDATSVSNSQPVCQRQRYRSDTAQQPDRSNLPRQKGHGKGKGRGTSPEAQRFLTALPGTRSGTCKQLHLKSNVQSPSHTL